MKYYANSMLDKRVMSTDAKELGILKNITIDAKTGAIIDLIVLPAQTTDPAKYRKDDNGHILMPFSAVSAVKDYIIVDKDKSRSVIIKA